MGGGTQALLSRAYVRENRHAEDEELVEQVRAGDDEAFEELYRRYRRRIAGFAYGMVRDHARAEDIAQEAFMSALRRMRETERPIAFRPWIHEIARNACIDQFRRARRAEEVPFESDEGATSHRARMGRPDPAPDAALDTKERLRQLCSAFGGLSPSHHEILVLRELEGLSYREIGDRMGLSRPAVESTLFRARRRLTEEYDELQSGRRCGRVQAVLSEVAETGSRLRDRRRIARHLSHCQPCRRHAHALGISLAPERQRLRERVAALLPIPAFLRRRGGGGAGPDAPAAGAMTAHGHAAADWSLAFGGSLEPAAGWAKAAMAAVTLAIASVGAGVATRGASPSPTRAADRPVAAAPATPPTRSSSATPTSAFDQRLAATAPAGAGGPTGAARKGEGSGAPSGGSRGGPVQLPGAPRAPSTPAATTPHNVVEKVTGAVGGGQGSAPAARLPDVHLPPVPEAPLPGVPSVAPQVPPAVTQLPERVGDAANEVVGTANGLLGG